MNINQKTNSRNSHFQQQRNNGNKVDFIMTNPPFGIKHNSGTKKNSFVANKLTASMSFIYEQIEASNIMHKPMTHAGHQNDR